MLGNTLGIKFPVAQQVMNGVKQGFDELSEAASALQDGAGEAAQSVSKAPLSAVAKMTSEKAREAKGIAKAFDAGIVPGIAATMQAFSPGNNATDMLVALGVELSPTTKSALSAAINGGLNAAFLPAAFMDIADIMRAEQPQRLGIPSGEVPSAHRPPPPSLARPGTRRPNGEVIACPPGYAEPKPGAPKPDLTNARGLKQLLEKLAAVAEALAKLVRGFDGLAPGEGDKSPTSGGSENVFANVPQNVPFEEFVFHLMMAIVKDQQADIKRLSEELAANAARREAAAAVTEAAKAAETNTQVMGTVVEAVGSGAGGQMGGALAKAISTQQNGSARATTERAVRDEEKLKESRAELIEKIKFEMQKLQELQQTMSNILNAMHDGAMGTIRNIK